MLPKAYADSIKRSIHIETMLIILILFYYFILHIRADFVHFFRITATHTLEQSGGRFIPVRFIGTSWSQIIQHYQSQTGNKDEQSSLKLTVQITQWGGSDEGNDWHSEHRLFRYFKCRELDYKLWNEIIQKTNDFFNSVAPSACNRLHKQVMIPNHF